MSRIGKEPISVSSNVDINLVGQKITVKGPKGEIAYSAPDCINIEIKDNQIIVSRNDDKKFSKAMFGTVRSLISNMIVGVTEGYKKDLIIEGVGYKAQLKGKEIPSLEETEKFLIQKALEIFGGNRRKASETLGISERTLYRKLDQYGLEKK